MVVWPCGLCGSTTNELLSTCNGCGAPRESAAPSAAPSADDGYVEKTVSDAQPRSAEELREVAARLLALAEEKEGGAAPTPAPAAAPTAGGSSSEESDDEGAPAPVAAPPALAPAAAPTAGGSSSDDSDDGCAAPPPATPTTAGKEPTKRPRGSPEEPIPIDDSQDAAPAAAPPTAGGSSSDDSEGASDDERDSKRPRRGDDSDDDVLVLEERTYLVERNRKLEDENEDLRRLAARAPPQQGAMTQLFEELIHADDGDADADRRRVERRGASTVRYFVSIEGRMEKILRLRGVAARCRGWRTKLDGIGAPRSLRENLGRLKGLRNAAAHEVDCERIAATTDDDLAGLIRDIDRDLKALEASAGAAARRVTR